MNATVRADSDIPRWDRLGRRMAEDGAGYEVESASQESNAQATAGAWFAKVPATIIRDRRLTSGMRDVLIDLLLYANQEGNCHPYQATIANDLGIARQEVNRRVRLLCKAGYLTVESGKGNGDRCSYHLHLFPLTSADATDSAGVKDNVSPTQEQAEGVKDNVSQVNDYHAGVKDNVSPGERKSRHITDPLNRSIEQIHIPDPEGEANASFVSASPKASPDTPKSSSLQSKKSAKPKPQPFAEDSEPLQLAAYLRDAILAHKPDARDAKAAQQPEKLQAWATPIDLMLRRDARSPTSIRAVIDFATADGFWQANILSPGKLREKFDTLDLQRQRKPNGTTSGKRGIATDSHSSSTAQREGNQHATATESEPDYPDPYERTKRRLAAIRAAREAAQQQTPPQPATTS